MGNFIIQDHNARPVGKTKNKMGGLHPEGYVTGARNMRMEKTSRSRRTMMASNGGGQGPEGAVAP